MNYIGKFITNFRDFYNEINSATLTGAIDVVVIRQPDGTFQSSPFHVRFGKIGVLRSREKVVDIEVNGEPIDIHMKLGESGEAFFVEEVADDNLEMIPDNLATSPIPPSTDIGAELEKMKLEQEFEERKAYALVKKETQIVTRIDEEGETTIAGRSVECVVLQMESSTDQSPPKKQSFSNSPPMTDFVPIKIEPVTESSIDIVVPHEMSQDALIKPDPVKYEGENKPVLGDDSENDDANDQRDDEANLDKVKRKRKKKSMIRRKPRPGREVVCIASADRERSDSRESASTDQDAPHRHAHIKKPHRRDLDEIFHMDDDDEDFKRDPYSRTSPIFISRSFSLPLSSSLPIKDVPYSWRAKKLSATFAGEFHPFSDGDVTPITSPPGSRPPSPKSDSEFERHKHDATCQTDMGEISWGWGELPSVPKDKTRQWRKDSILEQSEEQQMKNEAGEMDKRSMLGGMLNFMRTTKKMRHAPESEGIFLDDLNPDELDPEVAALYFPKFRSQYSRPLNDKEMSIKDEDAESGNGPSLPHSPNSVEGAIGGPMCIDSDSEERPSVFEYSSKHYNDLELSLCGGLQEYDGDIPHERFLQFIVTFDDFCENPSLLQNTNLVLRMGGKFYNWQTAGPMLLSLALFQRPLPEKAVMQLLSEHMPKKKKKASYSSWWSWRRPTTAENENMKKDQSEVMSDLEQSGKSNSITPPHASRSYEPVAIPPRLVASTGTSTDPPPTSTASINIDSDAESTENVTRSEKYMKTLFLSTDELASLNLHDGANEVEFSVTTAYQGTTRCKCYIYLWNYDDKIVISDIDGTITKSDVLGHILPIIGNDWAQSGVAQLFTKIRKNGYHFLYLSARAIGQARVTKEYLRNVRQGDLCLPDGPLLLSPTSLINAFHREVIEKKPEVFKISCLTSIKDLFPKDIPCPFYAGFGNKINDTWAYRAVDIPITRVFTINHRGELKSELIQTFESSYTRLSDVVDHVFPPLERRKSVNGQLSTNFVAPEQYSSFTYWRLPVASVTPSGSFTNISKVGIKDSPTTTPTKK